jgi:hypothetical protein
MICGFGFTIAPDWGCRVDFLPIEMTPPNIKMWCEYGHQTAPGWQCRPDKHHHAHIKEGCEIKFYDGSVKSIKTPAGYLEWNILCAPVAEITNTPAVIYKVTCNQFDYCNYYSPWDRAPVGFCYWEHTDGPAREHVNENHNELIAAIRALLPLPIARAVLKQMPLLTLDSWRADFRARWPMGRTLARALAGEI